MPEAVADVPLPPPGAQRLVRYIVGFGVSVALGLAPFLGKLDVPGFDALLTLIPNRLHASLLPLSAAIMGVIAVVIQWYGYDRLTLKFLRLMFRRILLVATAGFIALMLVHTLVAVKVPVLDGTNTVSVLVGFHRPPNPRCPAQISDLKCLREITLDPAEINSVWGDRQIQVAALALTFSYLIFVSAFAMLVGTLLLRDSYERGRRRHAEPAVQRTRKRAKVN